MLREVAPAPPITLVLVTLDGSRLAESAIEPAMRVALGADAKIVLLHVLEHDPPAAIHGEPHLTHEPDGLAYLDVVAERVRAGGITVETHVHENPERDVSASIVSHADELDASLIVLANHGS